LARHARSLPRDRGVLGLTFRRRRVVRSVILDFFSAE